MKCIIVANGALVDSPGIRRLLNEADFIIAADGGATHLKRLNIKPHAIIGDLDSLHPDTRSFYEKNKIPVMVYPSKKDSTDTDLCIDFALKKNADRITLIGVTGNRLDHTLANIFLLRRLADLKIHAMIVDAHNEIHLTTDHLELTGRKGDLLSVIPISDRVTGLTITGVEYPLENASISMGSSLGISNCFKETRATISITKGVLLVTKSRD